MPNGLLSVLYTPYSVVDTGKEWKFTRLICMEPARARHWDEGVEVYRTYLEPSVAAPRLQNRWGHVGNSEVKIIIHVQQRQTKLLRGSIFRMEA